jgi:flagellar biosynthesis/type III secretory pathway protein FliH
MTEELYTKEELEEHMQDSYLQGYEAGVQAEQNRYEELMRTAINLLGNRTREIQQLERLRVGGHGEVC